MAWMEQFSRVRRLDATHGCSWIGTVARATPLDKEKINLADGSFALVDREIGGVFLLLVTLA
jgi:hypothetical protein